MKKKLIGIFVCMLLITIILPVSASYEENNGIETQDDWIGKIRYFGFIRGYTTYQQFYEVDFVDGFELVTAFSVSGTFGFSIHRLRGIIPIPIDNFRGILTDNLCIGMERL